MPNLPIPGFIRRLVNRISDDEVPSLAASLAYRFLFAVFPFAIFLASLAAFVAPALGWDDPTGAILGGGFANLPPGVADQIRPQLEAVLGTTRPGLLSIGAVAALWAATGGIGAIIAAMNKAYDVKETRGFIRRTALALGLTALGTVGSLAAFVAIVGGSLVTQEVARRFGLDAAMWNAILLLRLPMVLALVSVAVALLFKLGPNTAVPFRWAMVGGALFAVGWLVATLLFGLYVANFSNYSNTYGALGGVVVLMLWFYLTALLLLVAAEVTSELASGRERLVVEGRRRETGSRPRRLRPAPGTAAAEGRAAG